MTESKDVLHDREAERAVLGALMVNSDIVPSVMVILGDTREAFFITQHAIIYESIVGVYNEKTSTDPVLIADHLKARGQLERIGDSVELYDLQARIVETESTEFHAQLVRDKYIRRRLTVTGQKVMDVARDTERELTDVVDEAQSEVFQYTNLTAVESFRSMGTMINDSIKEIERVARGETTPGIPTGFTNLDILTAGGLHRGELAIIAARPSMGKSTFVLNLMANIGIADGRTDTVAMFSLEMPYHVMATRMLSTESKIPFSRLRTGDIKDTEWSGIVDGSQLLTEHSSRLRFNFNASLSIGALRREARRLKAEVDNLAVIVVDYMQEVRNERSHYSNREQEVAEVSRELKAIAGELDVAVVACSQLNRELERRDDKRPKLADLRESGAIEQAADLVAFLHRDDYYDDEAVMEPVVDAELIIRKQRNGAPGTIDLNFMKEFMLFTNTEVSS